MDENTKKLFIKVCEDVNMLAKDDLGKSDGFEGKIIVFEGNDGAGKSTLVKYFSKYLTSKGIPNIVVKFNMSFVTLPSIKEGKRRKYGPYTNTLLHTTSLVDQFERFACKELEKGKVVICDRYIYSVIARGIARGVDSNWAKSLVGWVAQPDYVFYLDISPQNALERIGRDAISYWEAGQDIMVEKDKEMCFLEFQKKVRHIFKVYAPDWKFVCIDGRNALDKELQMVYTYITNHG